MSESGSFEEIPATAINAISDFSPIKFTVKSEEVKEENLEMTRTTTIDEEITFLARKADNFKSVINEELRAEESSSGGNNNLEERLQRKSDNEIFNTPKRERHEDKNLNIRSGRLFEMEEEKSIGIIVDSEEDEEEGDSLIKTPKKKGEMVKSLSIEFEQRLASIHVSPRPTSILGSGNTVYTANPPSNTSTNSTINSPSLNISASKSVRSMSPIRNIAQLSPVSKLNLNNESGVMEEDTNFYIETPKLVSPSKIVAAASAADIEKIKIDLESKVKYNQNKLCIYYSF